MVTETNNKQHINLFGLVGRNIAYSFSRKYFSEKFKKDSIAHSEYVNFDIQNINEFSFILEKNKNLKGLNVTIPYKEQIIPFLNKLHKSAKVIGAVNTIRFTNKGLIGYNTDYFGFKKALEPHLKTQHTQALILGTGGASKAVAYALKKLNIEYLFVSRNSSASNTIKYSQLSKEIIKKYTIIINCTPIGTFPNVTQKPDIPYLSITPDHLVFDLIYNPEETLFLELAKKQGAYILNGQKMLEFQAEKAWKIWNMP